MMQTPDKIGKTPLVFTDYETGLCSQYVILTKKRDELAKALGKSLIDRGFFLIQSLMKKL